MGRPPSTSELSPPKILPVNPNEESEVTIANSDTANQGDNQSNSSHHSEESFNEEK